MSRVHIKQSADHKTNKMRYYKHHYNTLILFVVNRRKENYKKNKLVESKLSSRSSIRNHQDQNISKAHIIKSEKYEV